MGRVWQTIRSYIWWSYDRGSVPYDIMVTLILAFIFITPLFVNFKDKPIERVPHPIGVVVYPDGAQLVYEIDAAAVAGHDSSSIEHDLLRVIEPIAGEVSIDRYETQRDSRGRVTSYKVWVTR
ncbi:MAG: hypothetical protein ACRD3E_19575 [Terriglobales bacterium]